MNQALHIYTYSVIDFGICMVQQGAFIGLGKTWLTLFISLPRVWLLRYIFILQPNMYGLSFGILVECKMCMGIWHKLLIINKLTKGECCKMMWNLYDFISTCIICFIREYLHCNKGWLEKRCYKCSLSYVIFIEGIGRYLSNAMPQMI